MTKAKNKLLAAFIAAIISVVMVMFIIPLASALAEAGGGSTVFGGGTGTENDPYIISNYEHLTQLAELINLDDTDYTGKVYKLTEDIDLGGKEWTPIGAVNWFNGTFDGSGFTISNFKSTGNERYYAGLFGKNSGIIKNVYLDKVNISTTSGLAAGLCVENYGTIEGCAVLSGSVDASDSSDTDRGSAAGICLNNNGTINKCYNMAVVTTEYYGAGIVKRNSSNSTVANCYNAGAVSDKSDGYIGGICAQSYGTIVNCLNFGELEGNNPRRIGGILLLEFSGTVINCYSDSDVCSAECVTYNYSTQTNVGTKTMAELCSTTLPTGLDGSVWAKGKTDEDSDASNSKFKTTTYTYPSLIGVTKEAKSATMEFYNFSIDDNPANYPNWQEYTEVKTADDLKKIKDNLSGNYVLMNDLDLTGEDIVIGTEYSPFTGKFSGDGHTISGVNLNKTDNYIGLFGKVEHGLIMNLAVEGNVKGGNCVGIICGSNTGGTIINCYAIGSVEAKDMAGGICGTGNPDSSYICTVKNCYFSGTFKGLEDRAKDAIGFGVGKVENCYYNSDLYTEVSTNCKGMSTFELTSSDALTTMGFTDSVWKKNANKITDANGKKGVAYFPSFNNSTRTPSVDFSADITFERTDDEELSFLDTFEVKYGVKIEFANDGSETLGSETLVNGTNCTLAVLINGESSGVTLDSSNETFETDVKNVGKSTYSLKCTPKKGAAESFLPADGITKSLTIEAAKITPTASDFEASLPQNPTYNGKSHTATVIVKQGRPLYIGGCGDITVKYFESNNEQVEQPINEGEYIVKIDVSGGENCEAAKDITADTWKFTIAKTTYNSTETDVKYNWETTGEYFVCVNLPTDMGTVSNISQPQITGENSILSSAKYEDGKVYFTFNNNNTDRNIGNTAKIIVLMESQNYNSVEAKVKITLNGLANQKAPSLDDFEIVQINNNSDITVEIKSELTGVEYSFDGVTWSDSAAVSTAHDTLITGYIRYAEISGSKNASALAYKQIRTAHGDISANHHDGKAATCTTDGIIEYWECNLCDKKFSDEAGTKEQASVAIPAGHSLTYIARVEATCTKTGNIEYWSCSECGKLFADANAAKELTNAETVISASGRHGATEIRNKVDPTNNSAGYTGDTVCIDCGEIITHGTAIQPIDSGYKPSGPTPSAETTTTTTEPDEIEPDDDEEDLDDDDTLSEPDGEPYIVGENGKIGWDAILNTINSADDGDTIIIDMNGATVLPKTILEGITGSDITLVLDMGDGFEWEINGNDVTAPRDVDMGVSKGANVPVKVINAVTGEFGYVTITLKHDGEFGFKAMLRVDLGKDSKGLFANLYYYLGKNKTELIDSGKIGSDGKAELEFTHASEYVIVIDDHDHMAKSADDTGDEVIVATSDSENANMVTVVTLSLVVILILIVGAAVVVSRKKRK